MDSSSIPSRENKLISLGPPRVVTQEWLRLIARTQATGKDYLKKAKEELERVLEAVDAGAVVEPGKYKVRIRTRRRRNKS